MDNYYKLLNINNNASTKEIINAYNIKINIYNYFKSLNKNQINEIKILKKALYILTTPELKQKYDDKIFNNNNIDLVFSVDNSWMKDYNIKNMENKKEINFSNRVFSLSDLNKKQDFISEIDTLLRFSPNNKKS